MLFTTGFLLSLAFALPAAAQSEGVIIQTKPGAAGAAQMVKMEATITAIDAETRLVTLTDKDGESSHIVAGPEVRNFAQLRKGDHVTLEYVESLTLELKKASTEEISRVDEEGALAAKPGEAPGGLIGRTITVVAEVVGLDAATQTVSLKGPLRTIELKVNDPEQFKLIAMGDRVKGTYVEAVAVAVEHVAKSE